VEAVELHRGLGVGVVGRLELHVLELWAEPRVEVCDGAHQVAETQVAVDHEALHLGKVAQDLVHMGGGVG